MLYVAAWLSGNVVGHINEVTLHQAGLVMRWVTICGYTISLYHRSASYPPLCLATSLAHVGVGCSVV